MNITVHTLKVSNFWIINYCYLIVNTLTDDALFVDPAWEKNKIDEKVSQLKVKPCGILLTHHHRDHINLAEPFADQYSIPVFMAKAEIDFYHFRCKNLVAIEDFAPFNLNSIIVHPMFTPGHTRGGTSYLIDNHLFTGDTLFIEGCGLCHGEGGDAGTMFDTMQMFKQQISGNVYVYPGHSYGEPVGQTFNHVLEKNVYLHFTNRDEFIAFRMRKNQKNLFSFK